MTNPVWEWMFRERTDPFQVNEWFQADEQQRSSKVSRWQRWLKRLGTGGSRFPSYPQSPRWAGCRFGQSRTELGDGRIVWIAGEHEDHYDPDFYIYNDVIVEHPDGRIHIFGYPTSVFRPTDFHSTTIIEAGKALLVIGNLGYPEERRDAQTPVYRLDTQSWQIEEVPNNGDCPGWISKHRATASDDGKQIILVGGKTSSKQEYTENIDDWSLSLVDFQWRRLTERKWPRVQVHRADEEMLNLMQLEFIAGQIRHPEMVQLSGMDHRQEFLEEFGFEPDMQVYKNLYVPSIKHRVVELNPNEFASAGGDEFNEKEKFNQEEDIDEDWNTKRFLIDGVSVRIVQGHCDLTVTVEGELPLSLVRTLTEELQQKLAILQQAKCQLKWIYPQQ